MSTEIYALDGQRSGRWTEAPVGEPGAAFDAVIEECSCARWSGPGGRTFLDLHSCVTLADDAPPEVSRLWTALLGLVNPQGEFPSGLPRWMQRAHEDTYKNLTSPDALRALVQRIDADPDALQAIVAQAGADGQELEGRALESLVPFLRKCAQEGWWVLGTEEGT